MHVLNVRKVSRIDSLKPPTDAAPILVTVRRRGSKPDRGFFIVALRALLATVPLCLLDNTKRTRYAGFSMPE